MKKLIWFLLLLLSAAAFTIPASAVELSGEAMESGCQQLMEPDFDEATISALAKTVWGEWDGGTKTEKAAVVWTILNRCDAWGITPVEAVRAEGQFDGYNPWWPVTDENREIVEDVLYRHHLEGLGVQDVGRVLPAEYLWFKGDGWDNWFRDAYEGDFNIWDWSLESPYE